MTTVYHVERLKTKAPHQYNEITTVYNAVLLSKSECRRPIVFTTIVLNVISNSLVHLVQTSSYNMHN